MFRYFSLIFIRFSLSNGIIADDVDTGDGDGGEDCDHPTEHVCAHWTDCIRWNSLNSTQSF